MQGVTESFAGNHPLPKPVSVRRRHAIDSLPHIMSLPAQCAVGENFVCTHIIDIDAIKIAEET